MTRATSIILLILLLVFFGGYACGEETKVFTLPQSLKVIEDYAFKNNTSVEGVLRIPESVTSIGAEAFSGCTGLTGVPYIPTGIKVIKSRAFYGCKGLSGVLTLPMNIIVAEDAFVGCTNLSVRFADETPAEYFSYRIETKEEKPEVTILGYIGPEDVKSLNIPCYIQGYPVTAIGDDAFLNRTELCCTISFPERLRTIGNRAFYGCVNIKGDLFIPNSVTNIGSEAFYHCLSFDGNLKLSRNLTEIKSGTFEGCRSFIGDLVIPDSVVAIEDDAFNSRSNYAYNISSAFTGRLFLSNHLTRIGKRAFANCGFAGELTIPEGVVSVEREAFGYCGNFTKLSLPSTLTIIGDYAFASLACKGTLVIPDSVVSIGASAFSYCQGFTGNLIIPDSVIEIGRQAFAYCTGFSGDLIIPDSVVKLGEGAFGACNGFNGRLQLPKSLTRIEDQTFYVCNNFTGDLIIPEGVTYIGDGAFNGCFGFNGSLIIPNSVKTIETRAFQGCKNLKGTVYLSNDMFIEEGAFTNCDGLELKYVSAEPTTVSLDKSSIQIKRGANDVTSTIKATVSPSSSTNITVTWSSSNTNIATVSNSGVVTAKAPGTVTITATAADGSGAKATCTVSVTQMTTGLTLNKTSATIKRSSSDKTETLTATVAPTNASNKTVTWSSSNANIATVNSAGVVTAKAPGTATITATAADGSGIKASCTITVTQLVTGITLNKTSGTLKIGGTETLAATISPANASNRTVAWSSSNTEVATVNSSGVVTAKAAGTATITAAASDGSGAKATYALTVASKPTISFTSYPTSVSQSQTGIDIVASLKGGVLPYTCQWTMYKDGVKENSTYAYTVTGTSTNWPIYQFGSAGVFYAQLSLTDALGQTATAKTPNCTVTARNLVESAPTITSISTKSDSVTLKWNAVTNAVKYIVKATRTDANWTGEYTTTSTTWTNDWFSSGTYSFTVTAVGDSSVSNNQKTSAAKSITVKVESIISGPTPTITVSGNNATLRWNEIANATWYEIEIYTSAGYAKLLNEGGSTPKYIKKIGSDELYHKTSYTFSSLGTGMYIVKVAACNPGHWAFGSTVSFVIGTATNYPVKAGPQVTAIVNGSTINVKWNAVENADMYDVFLRNQNGTLVKSLHTAENSCIFSGISDGTYTLGVSARNTLILGDDSGSLGGWKLGPEKQITLGMTNKTKWIHGVPYYMQNDNNWAGVKIGNSTIGMIGCTTTCLAMSESYRTGTNITPDVMASRVDYSGNELVWPSNYSFYGQSTYSVQEVMNYAYKAINSEKPLIIGGYSYVNGQRKTHWVVIVGYVNLDPNNMSATCFQINDPNSTERTNLQQFLDYRGTIDAVCIYGTPIK